MEPRFDQKDYRHEFRYWVRSHECDRMGVVHNARYLEILEIARIEYCRDVLALPMDHGTFSEHHRFFFARNAMDYYIPARFDDELLILTRVAALGKTSVRIEQIINDCDTGARVLEAEAVMVMVDDVQNRPKDLDPDLRERVRQFEHLD